MIFTTCPLLRTKYLVTGSPHWILISWLSFSFYLNNNSCFSFCVVTTCSGTNSCSVMMINSLDSRNCSRMYLYCAGTRLLQVRVFEGQILTSLFSYLDFF